MMDVCHTTTLLGTVPFKSWHRSSTLRWKLKKAFSCNERSSLNAGKSTHDASSRDPSSSNFSVVAQLVDHQSRRLKILRIFQP